MRLFSCAGLMLLSSVATAQVAVPYNCMELAKLAKIELPETLTCAEFYRAKARLSREREGEPLLTKCREEVIKLRGICR